MALLEGDDADRAEEDEVRRDSLWRRVSKRDVSRGLKKTCKAADDERDKPSNSSWNWMSCRCHLY